MPTDRTERSIKVVHKDSVVNLVHVKRSVNVKRPRSTVKVERVDRNVRVNHTVKDVQIIHRNNTIELHNGGRRGIKGDPGQDGRVTEVVAGEGIIVDNTDVSKPVVSATGGSGDKNFVYDFTMQHTLNINHALQKLPAVTVINSAGDKVEATVEYVDINNVIIRFTVPFSGRATLN